MPKRLFTTIRSSSPSFSSTPTSPTPSTFADTLPLPTVIVFDLDYTLWPFWVDTHVSGPLKPASPSPPNTAMLDRRGESYAFYPEVAAILMAARQRNITLSLASRTHAPDLAREMLRGLHLPPVSSPPSQSATTSPILTQVDNAADSGGGVLSRIRSNPNTAEKDTSKPTKPLRALDVFSYPQIYPGRKVTHLLKIQEGTRRAGREVAFADMLFFDDEGRNRDVERELGVTFKLVENGVTAAEVDAGVWEWRKRRGIGRRDLRGMVELEG